MHKITGRNPLNSGRHFNPGLVNEIIYSSPGRNPLNSGRHFN